MLSILSLYPISTPPQRYVAHIIHIVIHYKHPKCLGMESFTVAGSSGTSNINMFGVHLIIIILFYSTGMVMPKSDNIAHELFSLASECQKANDYDCAVNNYKVGTHSVYALRTDYFIVLQKSIEEKMDFAESHLNLV